MPQVLIVEALRSPVLDRRGPVSALSEDERAGRMLRGLVHRAGLDPRALEAVFLGGQTPGLGRLAVAAAGLPLSLPAHTLCAGHASGLAALHLAATAVAAGATGPVLAAGVSGPVLAADPGPTARWRAEWPSAEQAEARIASWAELSGDEVARWRDGSAGTALAGGGGPGAGGPVGGGPVDLGEVLDLVGDFADAPPGADRVAVAGLALADEEVVRRLRLRVRARVAAIAVAAGDPALAPMAVVPAVERALEAAGLRASEVDLIELDGSAPAAALASLRGLDLPPARACVLGFPAASVPGLAGLPRLCRLVHALGARRARFGLCAAADGLGQAWAVVIDAQRHH